MSTIKDILTDTLELAGIVGVGQTPAGYLLAKTLRSLNSMLGSWSADPEAIYFMNREAITLSANTGEYTIGSGGDLDTTRPMEVYDSFITIGSTNYPVKAFARDRYDSLSDKTLTGIPRRVYYDPNYPLGVLRFYPVPDSAYSMTLIGLVPFSTYALTDTFSLPPGYERAIVYNLVIDIAPKYGKQVPVEVAAVAKSSFDDISRANTMRKVQLLTGLDPTGKSNPRPNTDDLFP